MNKLDESIQHFQEYNAVIVVDEIDKSLIYPNNFCQSVINEYRQDKISKTWVRYMSHKMSQSKKVMIMCSG